MFVPECERNGDYVKKQCHAAVGQCWCVNGKQGSELAGTRTSEPLDCDNIGKEIKYFRSTNLIGKRILS